MLRLLKIDISQNRVFGLDLLRALAILFVVIGHGNYLLPEAWRHYLDYLVFDGVAIFFVLSGFLIGGILIKSIQQPFTGRRLLYFWLRRWFRTLPNYFLVLTLLCLVNYPFNSYFRSINALPFYIISQNLFWPHPLFFGEAWSISIEEWFYLLMPLLVFFQLVAFRQKPRVALLSTAIIILVSVTCFRWYRFEHIEIKTVADWDASLRRQVFTRLDSLMYGVIGAFVSFHYQAFWRKYRSIFLAAGILLLFATRFILPELVRPLGLYDSVFSFSLVSLGTLFLLPALSAYRKKTGSFFKMVTYISLISYSLYLLHLSLVQTVLINGLNRFVTLAPGMNYAIYWMASLLLSILLYKYYERPMMALREHPSIKALAGPQQAKSEEPELSAQEDKENVLLK